VSSRPVLRDYPSEAESRLLRSAKSDAPTADARAHAFAALGLAAGAPAPPGGAAARAAGGGPIKASLRKWLVIAGVGGGIAASVVAARYGGVGAPALHGLPATAPHPAEVSVEPPPAAKPAPPAAEPAPSGGAPETLRSPSEILPKQPAPRTTAARPRAPDPAADLAREVELLDAARRAVASGNPGRALATLDAYERQFAHPNLRPEASLVRLEALLALGRNDEASRFGRSLLDGQPDGPYARRIRSLFEGHTPVTR
jgi:hypothetical protein